MIAPFFIRLAYSPGTKRMMMIPHRLRIDDLLVPGTRRAPYNNRTGGKMRMSPARFELATSDPNRLLPNTSRTDVLPNAPEDCRPLPCEHW